MYGYQGRFLTVDLGDKTTGEMPLTEDILKDFIGGATLAAKLIYDHVKEGRDPLDPESPLVFSTGPFTGTAIPMVSRYAISGISPLTGSWGEATSGGEFPFRLKGAGFDGIFITGRAQKPAYLFIDNGTAEIRDASHLWRRDIYETQKLIQEELESKRLGIACIGKAGEELIRYSCVMNDNGRAAGRCGLGALMGSKNLKAVVVAGNMKTAVFDGDRIKELSRECRDLIRGDIVSIAFKEYGTLMYMDMGMTLGDVPAKYFQKTVFPVKDITGEALRRNYVVENYACTGCPIGCGREIKDFSEDIESVDGPEYETVAAFGPLCMNFDMDSIIRANHLCNSHGLDTISAGVSIAYAMYLYERGVLTKENAGMEIKWGDGKTMVRLVEMIVNQEGIGRLLSQGTLRMARELGRDEGEAAQVKGMEVPMHEGRAWHGLALSYATGPRGACHLKGDYYNVDMGGAMPIVEYNIMQTDRMTSTGKAESAAKYQNLKDLFDGLTLCKYARYSPTQICQLLNALTGWEIKPEDLLTIGERSINIKRAISNKLGLTREEDKLPKICLEPLDEGSTDGSVPDMDLMLREYYEFRRWDWETGKPSREKLMELGLNDIAEDLYR